MKSIFSLLIALMVYSMSFAQGTQTATVKYNGATYPADVVEYNLPPSEALKVIKEKMGSLGYNPEKSGKNGPLVYRNITNNSVNNGNPMDMIFNVSNKSKKQKNISTVSVITAAPGEIPAGKVKGLKGVMAVSSASGVGMFLSGFQSDVAAQAKNLAVSSKSSDISKAEKDLAKLKKEQANLEKKIKKLQSDLDKNTQNQQAKENEIANMKSELETLKNQ